MNERRRRRRRRRMRENKREGLILYGRKRNINALLNLLYRKVGNIFIKSRKMFNKNIIA